MRERKRVRERARERVRERVRERARERALLSDMAHTALLSPLMPSWQ